MAVLPRIVGDSKFGRFKAGSELSTVRFVRKASVGYSLCRANLLANSSLDRSHIRQRSGHREQSASDGHAKCCVPFQVIVSAYALMVLLRRHQRNATASHTEVAAATMPWKAPGSRVPGDQRDFAMSHPKLLPEMLPHQRALIDTSFEEGQYESGLIDLINCVLLRNVTLHRNALYTPPNEQKVTEPGSPSKMASRQQGLAHMPTQAASFAAQRLLMSLTTSTPPEILLRGLPSYSPPDGTVLNEEADSYVAKEARCIRQAKDCWSILKEGFIHETAAAPIKTRWQRRQSHDDRDAAHAQSPLIVAENAWPVLEWLIRLFQEDELRHNGHSPLLLSEIPLPRDNTGARWETDAALDIVFYSLSQMSERRRHCGIQLLAMVE
ncbi:antiviral protein [Salix suchowensis]|nr:antiviral protein [Salix suchowensis]